MLNKNLEALRTVNPKLADRIENVTLTDKTTLFLGPNDDVNIAYEDIALHRIVDPMGEALEVLEAKVPPNCLEAEGIIYVFGLGLGYLLRRLFISTQGQIVLFEPYLEVLRRTLESVDLSQELGSKRVSIITSIDDVIPSMAQRYLMGDKMVTIALPAYHEKEPELFLEMIKEIQEGLRINIIGQNTAIKMTARFTQMGLSNITNLVKYPDAYLVHNQGVGKIGLVVSAGPSLDKPGVMDLIRKHRDAFVIACVGQAAKALDKEGIVPDFVYIIEVQNVRAQLNGVSFLPEANLVLMPQVHQAIWQFETKRKFVAHTYNDALRSWLSRGLDKPLFGYNHQGTVSITAFIHLLEMGCETIMLLGQDLAFPDGRRYATHSVYQNAVIQQDENGYYYPVCSNSHELKDMDYVTRRPKNEKQKAKHRKTYSHLLVDVPGWTGETLKTLTQYATFIRTFSGFAAGHKQNRNLVNCSEGGALIDGFEHLPFVEAIEKYVSHNPNVVLGKQIEAYLQAHYTETAIDAPDFKKLYEYAQDTRLDLLCINDLLESAETEWQKTQSELEQKKTLTDSVISRMKKMGRIESELSTLSQENALINNFIRSELTVFYREYGRSLKLDDGKDVTGDIAELKQNLKSTQLLYNALKKGVTELLKALDEAFQDYPYTPSDEASSTHVTAVL